MWIFKNLKSPNLQSDTIKKYRLAIALIGGILMALATAPVSAWPLAWLALAPLWVMIASYEKPKLEEKKQKFFLLPFSFFLLPSLWGIGYHGLALSWIMGIHPMTWLGVPWWPSLAIAVFCWVFITLWGAALVAIWAWLFIILNSTPLAQEAGGRKSQLSVLIRLLIGTALWCSLEYIWSSGSLWWTSLSYTQSPHNLAILHLGQLSGPSAITAAIVAVNGLIAEAWSEGRRQKEEGRRKRAEGRRENLISYLLPVIFCLILHIIGFSLYSRPLTEDAKSELKIGIIQGNIPNEIKFNSEGWIRSLEGYTTGYKNLANQGVDAVLIPETALPFVWTNPNQRFYLSLYQAILAQKVVAWVGGFGQQEDSITNSLFTINGNGEIVSRYDKTKLVPLGEYIPFEQFIGSIINRLSPLDSHLVAGKSNQLFDTPFGRAIVGICYDSAFTEHFRRQAAMGGEFILTASNDAHYNSSMMAQHHAQDLMRGIETDRWVVRATNTGYSAFVNPHGETLWISGVNTYEVQAGNIYRRKTQTLYVRWGDWLTPLLLVLGVIAKVFQRG
ncbi:MULTISPECIES: apolipoprotein N-acyltransferase [Kamptonema]|uniref:apolipoprotein N-acyltransferase n=1 Tax=Kamptonema TaxID=1501433 RepID=UPI0001DAC33A|nr:MULTISPECIES: apolipoprotein N-acyltransferase [Kamptonema]CBN59003.1 Apolipoprotein N-acyltransferase [Kamptonema sp. PCC 6506]